MQIQKLKKRQMIYLSNQNYLIDIKKYIDNNKQKLKDIYLLKKEKEKIFPKPQNILNNNVNKKYSNILLIGETGVGKSTLINSLLELPPDKMAKTGSIEPCTMGEPEFYFSES